ncbi:peptide-methionine (S)-S-oxide reductase MsrA [uncultured Hoeflea sp.]|uniref:peptide-methionine (S)-S-oxide reductase MsrA n=1 Tax=uncultured Hoeflea sp. TaxID=538666 RepID=UPI0026181C42|nr:peptide-methionine (S)-S-oxide reductase MsrA [uncultured Hoeflea sp.]
MFLIDMFNRKTAMPSQAELLPGRGEPIDTAATHAVSGKPLKGPFADGLETAWFAMGKFWGAEKLFWALPGVYVTAAGFAGGSTPNPTFQEVVTGLTGHAQTVMVVYDPGTIGYARLLETFFEQHDPTQGMRQGSDIGTFYRSAIYTSSEDRAKKARAAMATYQSALAEAGHSSKMTTEIAPIREFYYAEAHHQQLLAKNPGAQSGLKPTGVLFPRD